MKSLSIAAAFAALLSAAPAQDNPFKPFDREAFEAHARSLGADDAAISGYHQAIEDESLALATDGLLRDLVAAYATAAAQAEDADPRAAISLAELIKASSDDYVRAFGRYHLGRIFLDADEPEQAADVFAEYLRNDKNRTPLDGEVAFFYASALAEVPMPAEAAATFGDFLELFPAASERFRAVAAQRKAELESQFQDPLHEIADNMKNVERKLRHTETGKPTQDRQKDIVTKLQEIIEQLEEQEKQSAGAPSGNQQSQSPAGKSAAPPGPARIGNLDKLKGAAERWGDMKDRNRDEIEAEVQAKFPGHYRKMLEKYYKKLSKGTGG